MPVPPTPSAAAAAAAAAGVLGPSRREVLSLYRSLLRIHGAVLPAAQRALGDRVRPRPRCCVPWALPVALFVLFASQRTSY